MSGEFRVLIIGGAIAGSLLASSLRKVASSITILEQNESIDAMDLDQGGAGFVLFNSCNQLLRSDLLLQGGLTAKMVRSPTFQGKTIMKFLHWSNGHEFAQVPLVGEEMWAVHRKTFIRALYDTAMANCGSLLNFQWGVKVAADDIDTANGIVKTSNGQVYHADLIIGADGLTSVVRNAIIKGHSLPLPRSSPLGVSCARWCLSDDQVPDSLREFSQLPSDASINTPSTCFHSDYSRSVQYRMRDDGLFNCITYFYDSFVPLDWPSSEIPSSNSWREGHPSVLKKLIDETNPTKPLSDLLAVPERVGLWQLRKLAPLPTWSHGKAVILGDAAHPMAPFQASGTSQTIEDVEALTFLLKQRKAEEPLKNVLDEFYKMRFLRASIVQSISDHTVFPQHLLQESRNEALKRENTGADSTREHWRNHSAYASAQMKVESAMQEQGINLNDPIIAR